MPEHFAMKEQLLALIRRFPNDRVDIHGVILDYIGATYSRLDQVLDKNPNIYRALFMGEDKGPVITLLKAIVRDGTTRTQLNDTCRHIHWALKCSRSWENWTHHRLTIAPANNPSLSAEAIAGFPVQAIIWQLSGIHFGEYNLLENDPRELAAVLGKVAADFPGIKPDLIIISGDVSSRSRDKEIKKFNAFCTPLSKYVWDAELLHRVLVVPGNHDTCWKEDDTADQLHSFREFVVKSSDVLTPFGEETREYDDGFGKVTVERQPGEEGVVPPFALVRFEKFQLEILLLVSAFYSGFIPTELREILGSTDPLSDRLVNLLREDKGQLSREYIFNLSRWLQETSLTRIAVIHHNLYQFGAVPCANELAPQLLETLFQKNSGLVFHGHVHLVEDLQLRRPVIPGYAFPIFCPTLTSGSMTMNKGFNVHLLGHPGTNRKLMTLVWQLSMNSDFNDKSLFVHYLFELDPARVSVRHGKE